MAEEEAGRRELAEHHFRKGYELQMKGELEAAIGEYQRSIELHPTAEAHTFLGWTYSFQGRIDEAIAECHRAIAVDPTLGNPYNDIGVYLMQKGEADAAVPWFQRAMEAERYENPEFPHANLARIWERKGRWADAVAEYRKALGLRPNYAEAARSLQNLLSRGNGTRYGPFRVADRPEQEGQT
jgi:tetratricopeptide (TPR) repeat protein